MRKALMILLAPAALASASAAAGVQYELTVTNSSRMPISPAVVYAIQGQQGTSEPGTIPSAGFVKLCQTGNPDGKAGELSGNRAVKFVSTTAGPILPGQSETVTVKVADPFRQSVHFEAMYGLSKATCSVIDIDSRTLYSLALGWDQEVIRDDHAIDAGAFTDPALPPKSSPDHASACATAPSAIQCLRDLSVPAAEPQVKFFRGYLPSLLQLLEDRYGAAQVQQLLLPTSAGAVRYRIRLKGSHR